MLLVEPLVCCFYRNHTGWVAVLAFQYRFREKKSEEILKNPQYKKWVNTLTEALRGIHESMRLALGQRAWLYQYIGKNARVLFEMQKITQWVILHTLWLEILSHFRFDPGGHSTQPENRQWDDVAASLRSWQGRAPIPSAGGHEGCSKKSLKNAAIIGVSLSHHGFFIKLYSTT